MASPATRIFYCYPSFSRNSKRKENTITWTAKDAETKETKYILQGIKPDKRQIHSTILRKESHPEYICIQTCISAITPRHEDIDSITGRPFTHRLSWGAVVTETPVTGYWRPRRFEFKGRKYVWLKEGLQTRLYEYSSSRTIEKRKSTVTEFETLKPALASETAPFWAGVFLNRNLEVRVAEGTEDALMEVILAGALIETMVTRFGH